MKYSIKVNSIEIDLSAATTEIQDHNGTRQGDEEHDFDASSCEVVVWIGSHGFVYQTSGTLDAGGISSKIKINGESGAYDSVLAMLDELGAINNDQDKSNQVYAAGEAIGNALGVQKTYDGYLSELGHWERGDGMDANSEKFVSD